MIRLALIAWLALCGVANAQLSGGVGGFPGPGTAHSVGAAYVGPGDTFTTSPYAAYSCSEAFTAAYATALGNACDLVDSSNLSTVICTLKFAATGLVDLAGAYCTGGLTPAAKCAAATGGVCLISRAYDHTGNLRHAEATASMPTLTFSSTPTGALPAINCGPSGGATDLKTVATYTVPQPFTLWTVYMRNSGTITGGAFGGPGFLIGSNNSINSATVFFGVALNATAADSAWHALGGLGNGASGAINVDGTDASGTTSTASLSAGQIRLCRANGSQLGGLIAEAAMWASSTTSTDRGNLNTNARLTNRYTNF